MHKILFFSGTGNTAFIAEQIESRLREKGLDISSERIEKLDPRNCHNLESLYFGFPIYACDMPDFVLDFVKALPDVIGTPVRLFSTKAYYSGKALLRAAALFTEKGYTVTSIFERKMPGSDGLAFLNKEGKMIEKMISNFNSDLSDLYQWIDDNERFKKSQMKIDIGGKIIGSMLKMVEGGMKKKYKADERCISCGLCTRICPVGNIQMIEKKIQFDNHCFLCMRCIHQCPVEAIQIGKGTVDKFRYKGPTGKFSIKS